MELRQLRYFIAVAEEKSLTRAARRLNISQPPLGRQLSQLEDELGVKLIDRQARPLQLTPAGVVMLDHAREILQKVKDMESAVRSAHAQDRARLILGFTDSCLYGAFPEIMRRLRALNDVLQVELLQMGPQEQAQALIERRIDLGFSQTLVDQEGLEALVLRRERLVIATPLNHPLTLRRSPIPLADLKDETVIVYPGPPHPSFGDQVLELLQRHGLATPHLRIVQGLHAALGLVAAQLGVTIVPEPAQEARTRDVRYLPIKERDATEPVVMLRRTGERSELTALVMRVITQINLERGVPMPKELAA